MRSAAICGEIAARSPRTFLDKDIAKWANVVKTANIQVEQ